MSNVITPEVVTSLAAKLGDLDLTDDEQRVLDALLERAAEADIDVEGYGVVFEVEVAVKSGQPMGAHDVLDPDEWVSKVGRAVGADVSKLGVWTDMRP